MFGIPAPTLAPSSLFGSLLLLPRAVGFLENVERVDSPGRKPKQRTGYVPRPFERERPGRIEVPQVESGEIERHRATHLAEVQPPLRPTTAPLLRPVAQRPAPSASPYPQRKTANNAVSVVALGQRCD